MRIMLHTLCGCTKKMKMTGIDMAWPIHYPIMTETSKKFPGQKIWRARKFQFKGYTGRWFKLAHFEELWDE